MTGGHGNAGNSQDCQSPVATTVTSSVQACSSVSNAGDSSVPGWEELASQPVLHVHCKKTSGELVKEHFGSGSRGKCIRVGKQWFSPSEFEVYCGRSASKDWKRSIRFCGEPLHRVIQEGFLQQHATCCSCGTCNDDSTSGGPVRLSQPYKRKKKLQYVVSTGSNSGGTKFTKQSISNDANADAQAGTPLELPVANLGHLTMAVPGLILESMPAGSHSPQIASSSVGTRNTAAASALISELPLEKAWEQMNEELAGLEKSVAETRTLFNTLRERSQQELVEVRRQLQREKVDAINHAKLEAELSLTSHSPATGFLVQVQGGDEEEEASSSLQPVILDSVTANMPNMSPVSSVCSMKKKCANCNRESNQECSGCHGRAYCSSFCQRRDWPQHQPECSHSTSVPSVDALNSATQVPGYIFML